MTNYSVKQLSELAGVTVKTLHHYDKIGLLKPAFRTEKNYRYYTREQLFKLQQILFYRELDFSLKEIDSIINDESFNLVEALKFHKEELIKRSSHLDQLIETVDKTIDELKNNNQMMTDEELYKGFTKEQKEAYRNEAVERWGEEKIKEVENRIKSLGESGWEDTQKKGEEINQLLGDLMDLEPSDKKVQETIALHHKYMNTFYEVTAERYEGLGKMYTEDERFTAFYDKYNEGLASFLYEAIKVYCQNGMKVN